MTPLHEVIKNKKTTVNPIWIKAVNWVKNAHSLGKSVWITRNGFQLVGGQGFCQIDQGHGAPGLFPICRRIEEECILAPSFQLSHHLHPELCWFPFLYSAVKLRPQVVRWARIVGVSLYNPDLTLLLFSEKPIKGPILSWDKPELAEMLLPRRVSQQYWEL